IQDGSGIAASFVHDDFLFLARTRGASLATLLAPNEIVSHYYRPWSRELHFFALQALFGPHPAPFHVANLLLWLAASWMFFRIAAETAGVEAAGVAPGRASLVAGGGAPVAWGVGRQ